MIFAVVFVILFFIVYLSFAIQGAPYIPSNDASAKQMLKLIKTIKPKRILDMGSGDGKLVIALAQAGYKVDGIELNPWLVYKSRRAIKTAGLETYAKIKWGSFWKYKVSQYGLITVYGISHIMPKLERKLSAELKPGSYIVSNYFKFPNLKPTKQTKRAKLYRV